jgi:valyl-tRNA synthetase
MSVEPGTNAYDAATVEAQCRSLWTTSRVFEFDPNSSRPVFSVDTPPPYVSASHLHVGHAMSYAQADFIVRYKRMRGFNIFYPMGFDDNGLPTERYVEQKYGVNASDMDRGAFVDLCLEETRKTSAVYRELWQRLGLSVDWSKTYSTIDSRCQKTAQGAFILLYRAGRIRRAEDAILWCPLDQTALAQADVDDVERTAELHTLRFEGPNGSALSVATTRPELLPACVALYANPSDDRFSNLVGGFAVVPFSGHTVEIRSSTAVDPEFGTGLMMVCTFGDTEDVVKWRSDRLNTRLIIASDGRFTPEAGGELEGLTVTEARKLIVARGRDERWLVNSVPIKQRVGVHERCGTPVEFQIRLQWLLSLSEKELFRWRSDELDWRPTHMKRRLEAWIDGLKWDWNISRQRHYGVPFPVWFCDSCDTTILPAMESLPVDPTMVKPPTTVCSNCGASSFHPDNDVMDTWMTSSLTPQVNTGWAASGFSRDEGPMSLRVQGFEIIRTWLFYSLVQAEYLFGRAPWTTVMISGWGLNEQGKKISKRDLDSVSRGAEYNRYVPDDVIERYGADALRGWAARARLGNDLRYHEKDVRASRKLAVKLWNAGALVAKLAGNLNESDAGQVGQRSLLDQWLLSHLDTTIEQSTSAFDAYEYMHAYEVASRFFWQVFCDRYLELAKEMVTYSDQHTAASLKITLDSAFRAVLGVFAPFMPHVTEALYQARYANREAVISLHLTAWPTPNERVRLQESPVVNDAMTVWETIRALRTELSLGSTTRIRKLIVEARNERAARIVALAPDVLQASARADNLEVGQAAHESRFPGLFVDFVLDSHRTGTARGLSDQI